jgi:hypothetical protein
MPQGISVNSGREAMNTVETSSGRGTITGPSRRGFLEGIGATAFLLAFQLPVSPGRAGEPPRVSEQFNAFLAIGEDDVGASPDRSAVGPVGCSVKGRRERPLRT